MRMIFAFPSRPLVHTQVVSQSSYPRATPPSHWWTRRRLPRPQLHCARLTMSKAAILAKRRRQEKLAEVGAELNKQKWEEMRAQIERFEANLRAFATQHKESIQRDANFRAHFHQMCAAVGVDPLTSRKGLWSELLGVGDYYYELAVRAIEACVATRPLNGGIIALDELVRILRRKRSAYVDDVSR